MDQHSAPYHDRDFDTDTSGPTDPRAEPSGCGDEVRVQRDSGQGGSARGGSVLGDSGQGDSGQGDSGRGGSGVSNLWGNFASDDSDALAPNFRTALTASGHAALSATGARAVLILALPDSFGFHAPLVAAYGAQQDARALLSLAEAAADAPPRPAERGTDPALVIKLDGPPAVEISTMRVVLLDPDGLPIGAMCYSFDMAQRDCERTTALASEFAKAVAAAVFGLCSKYTLEYDLSASGRRIQRLEQMAQTDRLTGLENNVSFEDKARHLILEETAPLALILVDIDHFKPVNDLYGHQFGDSYIKTVAEAIVQACPETALVGRIGGDEFAVVLKMPAMYRGYVNDVMTRCRSAILRAAALLGKPDLGRVSLGAAIHPDHAGNYATLFNLADSALYVTKTQGRGGQTVFQPDIHQRFNHREMKRKFSDAITNEQILPYFQPVHCLKTGACAGFELLVRWQDPARGLLSPGAFSSILEDHRHAEQLTQHLVQKALSAFSEHIWRKGKTPYLAINLSSFDLMNPEFVFEFQGLLADVGADWRNIIIEVTEKIMLGPRNGQIFRTLGELRTRGARVALDDFGTGYGGLRHLSGWPVDILKIDRHFVARMEHDATDSAVVQALISLAARGGFSITAEGIETARQLQALMHMDCGYGQGFLFSTAVPAEQLASVAIKRNLGEILEADLAWGRGLASEG